VLKNAINFGKVAQVQSGKTTMLPAPPFFDVWAGRLDRSALIRLELNEILGNENLPKYDYAKKAV